MGLDRKHVIAGALIAFVSWAKLTDWLPGLRWIPYAFIAGAFAALIGTAYLIGTTSKGIKAGEDARATFETGRVQLGFARAEVWEEEKASLIGRAEYRRPTIFPDVIKFSKAVDGLLDLILRDFVTSWYGGISPRPLFQHEIDRCIRSVLLTIAARVLNIDVVELGVSKLLPIVTTHLKEFYEAERAVRGRDLSHNVTESEELDSAIAAKYKSGKLHMVASLAYAETAVSQQNHLRLLISRLLPVVLPESMKTSPAVTAIVKEIVTCAVLGPVFTMLQDPDTWNQMIVNIGGPMLQDRKTVRKLRAALDQHAPVSPRPTRSSQFPRLRPQDPERQFERFIRAIRHISTISEARRFRSEIISQIRRDSAIEGQDTTYLRRLETGKRLLDSKIASLTAVGGAKPKVTIQPDGNTDTTNRKRQASLRDLLYDASGLSYFMEFMDRSKLMRLVQFWLVVDGFRSPLEGDMDEPSPEVHSDPERMDIAQMYEGYLKQPELQASDGAMQAVKQFIKAGPKATARDYTNARQAVLQTQTRVYERMRKDQFETFKRSDLYYKWLAIDDNPASTALQAKQSAVPRSPDAPSNGDKPQPKTRRSQLGALNKEPELRRAVLSSSDLKTITRSASANDVRHSLDAASPRSALFEDEVEDERMVQSVNSLNSYDSDAEAAQQAQEEAKAVNAMQLALDNIVGDEDDKDSLFSDKESRHSFDAGEQRVSSDMARPALLSKASDRGKPSIASLGLVGAPSSRGVFIDDLFGEEAAKFPEDEREDSDLHQHDEEDKVQEAAPGDLGLTEAIDALNGDIERLHAQRNIVDSLTTKAELTNNSAELRILRKSEQSLQREIRRKELQKQQYVVQESDNSLYGRAQISISSVMVGREEDGYEYALYVVEVRRQAGENMPAATWAVTRRYSQFHELHKRLRARFPAVRDLDFPRRQTLFTLQKDFLQRRRQTLERYLRSLLLVPAICRSREFRAFLSQSAITSNGTNGTQVDARDFVTRIYNSVSDGMEDFLGNIPALDQLSLAGQNLISAATAQINGESIEALDPATQDPATAAEAEAELNAYETKEFEPFVKPICDIFLELFELSRGNSWLRGRTVVVILHQLLGGTIERKVRETAKTALQDDSLAGYVNIMKGSMWPDGKMRPPSTPRTAAEKARTRKEAGVLLGALFADAGSVVGKANAVAASRKLIAAINNQRLNTHLIFTLTDELIKIVFPEVMVQR